MRVTDRFVFFYTYRDVFSQWHQAPFVVKGITFPTNEHFMMYVKSKHFKDEFAAEMILRVRTPREAKAWGRKVKGFVKEDWEAHCKRYVYIGNKHKFTQNPHLLKLLIEHAGKTFVEASPSDKIWGVGLGADDPRIEDPSQWPGTNWLGEILTQLAMDLAQTAP